MPLRIAAHLKSWGVEEPKIIETVIQGKSVPTSKWWKNKQVKGG